VLNLLSQDRWQIKLSKCSFARQQISYLGHVISHQGVATDPAKIDVVTSWPIPTNCKELRGFLGLAWYYRKFVRHLGILAKPLTTLLKKHILFIWTSEHNQAFQALKSALSSVPVLALPNFTIPFALETDASGTGIGAVLTQEGHPLAFVSRALGVKNQGLSTYEKEYLAIILAVDQWRPYLQHAEFIIYTDQRSLSHLTEQQLHTPWQQRVFTKLLGLQYKIVYKKGVENGAADALSPRPPAGLEVFSASTAAPQWLSEVIQSYNKDPKATKLLTELSVQVSPQGPYSLQQGLIRYKGRVWVGDNVLIQRQIMSALHDSPLGGHSGFPVTYRRIKQIFAWPRLKQSVRDFMAACSVCQQAKPDRAKYPSLLQPLPIPDQACQVVSLDFIEGLPCSGPANCILVVVDTFSKYAHFIGLLHPFSALKVAQAFMTHVYKLHGLPQSLVSDRDHIFTSHLWQELFRLSGTKLQMSTAYHPQSDGQTERVNQCLETFLRSFTHSCPTKWSS
jgi:hypothetical protein